MMGYLMTGGHDFRARKARRTAYYFAHVYRWRQRKCTACNGSGRYDSTNSPACGICNGTGKERYKAAEEAATK